MRGVYFYLITLLFDSAIVSQSFALVSRPPFLRSISPSSSFSSSSSITALSATVVSPFESGGPGTASSAASDADEYDDDEDDLPLTAANVEMVLDEMRPYLKADGGNVRLAEIDGPVVKLELEGACGTW